MRHTENAPYWTCAIVECAKLKCVNLDLRHSEMRHTDPASYWTCASLECAIADASYWHAPQWYAP